VVGDRFEFRILGPTDVRCGDTPLRIGAQKQRAVLAMLLLNANRVVSTSALIDGLWGDDPPSTAGAALQVHVGKLRQTLHCSGVSSPIVTRAPGYLVQVDTDGLDVARHEDLARRGREALEQRRWVEASSLFSRARGQWRGPALADVADQPFAYAAVARLEEERLAVMADGFDADLGRGAHAEIVSGLREATALHPLRERFWEQLVLALYRAGNQAEALAAFQSARSTLVEHVGIGPGARLRELETAVLNQSPSLDLVTSGLEGPPPNASTIVSGSDDATNAWLELAGSRFVVATRTTIGRHPSSSLVVADGKASRDHAVIRATEEGFTLHDVRSTNGTFVNGKRVVEARLEDGDMITVGDTDIVFHLDDV
jgi:DNA-binding SARP family transcriptional activator